MRVLVVDDERLIADTLSLILATQGHDAIPAYSPFAALASLETHRPHVVISDVVMPEMDGIEMAIRMKALHPEVNILLFSGLATTCDLLEAVGGRGPQFEVVPKPVHPLELLSRINSCSAGALGSRPSLGR